ncbi:MAG: response regulator [Candidatus Omnitrophica bacterium]|nr:response regulator [Candidatus Omnitrophota bacterium]
MLKKTIILVVDDDKVLCRSFKDVLELDGYKVITAETRVLALKAVGKTPPDVILVDIRLPDGDGLDLIKEIKQIIPDVLPIIITGYGSLESAIEAIKTGIYGYILKPFDVEAVKKIIKKAIEKIVPEIEIFRGRVKTWEKEVAVIADDNECLHSWLNKRKEKYKGKCVKVVLITKKDEPKD